MTKKQARHCREPLDMSHADGEDDREKMNRLLAMQVYAHTECINACTYGVILSHILLLTWRHVNDSPIQKRRVSSDLLQEEDDDDEDEDNEPTVAAFAVSASLVSLAVTKPCWPSCINAITAYSRYPIGIASHADCIAGVV